MHLEIFVEEPSSEAALRQLLPKIVGPEVSFRIFPHQGKRDLLSKLPDRLRGYRRWLPEDWVIVVLMDSDGRDCIREKEALEQIAWDSGLLTRTAARGRGPFQVLNRLAIHELEAWFFGDVAAVCAAYPGVPTTLGERARYRDPDSIVGTWEALEKVLQSAGYHLGGLAKIEAARAITSEMEPERNRSRSFQAFRLGLLELVQG